MKSPKSNPTECEESLRERLAGLEGSWIAVFVKTGWEMAAAKQLSDFGYERYLPLRRSLHRLGRGEHREAPLFPGYVFCRFQSLPTVRIMRAHGVLRIVGHGGVPIAVPDVEMDSIRRVLESGLTYEPCKALQKGQRVRVDEGPLRGVEGTVLSMKSGSRLIVGVQLLQRFVAVELPGWHVTPLPFLAEGDGMPSIG